MATGSEHQITIHLDASVKERLRAAAECKGVEVSQYCLDAIRRELSREEEDSEAHTGQPFDFDDLIAFRDALLGDRKFPGNSADIIREEREIRSAQIEGHL